MDSILQPIVQTLPSHIKDTTHLHQQLHTLTPKSDTVLFTMDVTSLYTVIPHQDGLLALQHFLDRRQNLDPPSHIIVRLAELVLSLNAFQFDGSFFRQKCGVAMGTKMGPSFANLFVGYVEMALFDSLPDPHPDFYGRYIDDIFGFGSPSTVANFIQSLSKAHPSLKFTSSVSQSVTFLDLRISVGKGLFETSVHYKPTDSHSYLLYSSCHPRSQKDSIPFSQFLRLRRICSNFEDFKNKVIEMISFFVDRGYPLHLLERAKRRVCGISRHDALFADPHPKDKKNPLIVTYHPTVPKLARELLSATSHLHVSQLISKAPSVAYRRPPNLRTLLVKSSLKAKTTPDPVGTIPGTAPCNAPKCLTCKHLASPQHLKLKIPDNQTCKSANVIYAISCTSCPDVLYIGETDRRLHERFREHRRLVTQKLSGMLPSEQSTHVANHFSSPGHTELNMRVCVVRSGFPSSHVRKREENRLIFNLKTEFPRGLNTKLSFAY